MRSANAIKVHRKSGGAERRDLRFREPFVEMFFDRVVMGLRPTQGNEKHRGRASTLYQTVTLSFVIPSEAEGSAVQRTFRECFS